MRKIVLAFLIILVSVSVSFGASTKVSELTETQTLTDDDLFLVSTYATGSYTSKYIAKKYLKTALGNVTTILNDTLWDAAGDLVYGTGSNAGARLAIGAPYALLMTNSGATAPAWTYTIGATGTRFTAGFFTNLTVTNAIAGSVTGNAGTATALAANPTDCSEGKLATAIDASGNLTCGKAIGTDVQAYDSTLTALAAQTETAGSLQYYTAAATPAVLAKGTAYQVLNMNSGATAPTWTSTLGATDTRLTKIWATDLEVTNAPTVNGAALTTILQPLNDDLTTLSNGGTANCLWGEKSDSSGIECKTSINIQLDDSAAQFKDATDSTKTMQLELGSITTETKRTLTVPDADGTIALVKTEKLAVFNIPGTSDDNTVVDAYIPVASTITGVVVTTTGAACSAVVDIWADTYANFPATNDDSIVASAPPTLSSAQAAKPNISTWTTAIAADSVLRANLDSSDCAGNIQVTIYGTK